jgi:beta-mannosidase
VQLVLPGETFYIKVNGLPIFAKGSNMVPLRVLHSSMTRGMIADTIQHALGANMNMIRIWGGGHYQVMRLSGGWS